MSRSVLSGCLFLLTVLLLAGCGSKAKTGTEGESPKTAADPSLTAKANPVRSTNTPREPATETPRKSDKAPSRRSSEVEEAAQTIKKLGGIIVLEDKEIPESPIIGVIFHNSGITGDKLEPLTKIPTLREVKLTTCYRITDLTYICRISGLRTLLLHKSNLLKDDALQPLVTLERLTTLSLPTATSDAGLEHVGKITSLTHLDLTENSKITDAGLGTLAGLKNLTHLKLAQKIGDAGLSQLSSLTSLESLDCSGCRGKITNDGLRHLVGNPRLQELDLRGVSVTDAGLDHLSALKNLRTLRLTRLGKVTDQAVIRLKMAIPRLEVQR